MNKSDCQKNIKTYNAAFEILENIGSKIDKLSYANAQEDEFKQLLSEIDESYNDLEKVNEKLEEVRIGIIKALVKNNDLSKFGNNIFERAARLRDENPDPKFAYVFGCESKEISRSSQRDYTGIAVAMHDIKLQSVARRLAALKKVTPPSSPTIPTTPTTGTATRRRRRRSPGTKPVKPPETNHDEQEKKNFPKVVLGDVTIWNPKNLAEIPQIITKNLHLRGVPIKETRLPKYIGGDLTIDDLESTEDLDLANVEIKGTINLPNTPEKEKTQLRKRYPHIKLI